MSIVTTRPQRVFPLSDVGIELTSGPAAWVNPASWTPFFTTTADTVIAGIVVQSQIVESFSHLDIELAIGTGATPVERGCFTYYGPNSGIGGPSHGPQPQYPIGTIPTGTLVSCRLRSSQSITLPFALLYYEEYDGDIADFDTLTLGRLPAAADMVEIAPAGEWLASDWVPVGGQLEVATDVVALLLAAPDADVDCRWELGRLADGGSVVEHVTTFASATRATVTGRASFAELPMPFPFAVGEWVHVRLRKSGTSTATYRAALMVFRRAPEPGDDGGTIGPLLWITMSYRPPVVT